MSHHPSNDIANNLGFFFNAPSVEDEIKQGKLIDLENDFKKVAQTMLQKTPQCADKSAAFRKLREAFELSTAAVLNDPEEDHSWPPPPKN